MTRSNFRYALFALSLGIATPSWSFAQISAPSFGRSYTSTTSRNAVETETVRERFPNGKIHIERQVALDENGNFVNHGTFQEWSANGDLIISGQYTHGKRTGTWIKMCQVNDSTLFSTYPYSKFTGPFQTTVEFVDDKMNGIWVIQDAQNKIVSQIALEDGQRHGLCTFFHPSGEVQFEAEYTHGILNGRFVEKDVQGKIVREDNFIDGQRTIDEKEYFNTKTKSVKVEAEYLSPPNVLITPDDFFKTLVANYENKGAKILHGQFRSYFENGQINTFCTYEKGILNGNFENFFASGQQKSEGTYQNGIQVGKWTWWHENGMRKAVASYQDGRPTGEVLAWNEQGIRVKATNNLTAVEAPINERQVPVRTQVPVQSIPTQQIPTISGR